MAKSRQQRLIDGLLIPLALATASIAALLVGYLAVGLGLGWFLRPAVPVALLVLGVVVLAGLFPLLKRGRKAGVLLLLAAFWAAWLGWMFLGA